MQDENISLEALIADANDCLRRTEHSTSDRDPIPIRKERPKKKRPRMHKALLALATAAILLLETVLLLAGTLYGVMFVLAKGPSPTAQNLFVRSVRETSAVGFLANLFYTEAEIQEMIGSNIVPEYDETDSSLIQIPQPKPEDETPAGPEKDAWGLTDEDGDGIIIEEVRGEGYYGYMMVVLDPSRVIMGSVPESYGSQGYTVEQMAEKFDAVAGINGGGFYDPDGKGNGSIPDTMVVYDGQIYYAENGTRFGFAGFDSNHILHVGNFTQQQIKDRDIQYGVCFGPVLVVNGEAVDPDILDSGVNPRTAIGQRSDGAVLMLVINGRQIGSLGATFADLAEIFLSYGAVNACNLDGGSSSMMWYDCEYVNNSASVIGIRPIPTSFLVLKEGTNP